ncbi:hypothetical protein [Streptomyces sp. CC208A]|uniref:hypothetical protein n=1 Tax=Streptomyces sp. CC208A TaxID=3044573 RepID=UPI0024A889B7|nr:hypothetical protein [Streptomyces sp. CC208A]
MPQYRNENTSDVVEYEQPSPRLEMLPNWTRLDPVPEQPPAPPADPTERPARNAPKDAWQAYARTRAQDSDEEAAIDGLTKDQLIEQYGGEG